ncbi:MAG: ABC transporter permease subunit [Natronomonas sp.]
MNIGGFAAIVRREVQTVARTRAYGALIVVLSVVFLGVIDRSEAVAGGYVPSAVDLLLPLEVLVPVVAIAMGYRAFAGDNDDLSVLSTYPLGAVELVGGMFLGRLAGLVVVLGVPLLAVMAFVVATPGVESAVFATTGGADSPILFVRFVVLTLGYGAVVLSITMAASVLARSSRAALALAVGVFVAVVAGGDLLVLVGLSAEWIGDESLRGALAASPNSAYRGLVLETVVGVVTAETGYAAPIASAVSMVAWTVFGLLVTGVVLSRRGTERFSSRLRRRLAKR